mmetsp:Transcript_12316/g.31493  ORF Transcript_12316/g.31493 Transcript_12316/m.31493 type:complete len:100 (+) Transcript_12316:1406-1705(+)
MATPQAHTHAASSHARRKCMGGHGTSTTRHAAMEADVASGGKMHREREGERDGGGGSALLPYVSRTHHTGTRAACRRAWGAASEVRLDGWRARAHVRAV